LLGDTNDAGQEEIYYISRCTECTDMQKRHCIERVTETPSGEVNALDAFI